MQGTEQQEVIALLGEFTPVPRKASTKRTMQVSDEDITRLDNSVQALDNAKNIPPRPEDRRRGHTSNG